MNVVLGKNVKITVPRSARAKAREVYGALDATLTTPRSDMDVFGFADHHIGYAYVADADALTAAQMRLAPWLELVVDDVARTQATLERLAVPRIEYDDKTHAYYEMPGGVVFRIAMR